MLWLTNDALLIVIVITLITNKLKSYNELLLCSITRITNQFKMIFNQNIKINNLSIEVK